MKYDVAFIVLNWRNSAETIECVNSLKKLNGSFKNQIIIVDNESSEATFEPLSRLKNVMIIKNIKNLGFAGGVNSGLRKVDAKYTALINNDMVVDKEWLVNAIKVLDHTNEAVAISGTEYAWDNYNPVYNTGNEFVSAPIVNPDYGYPVSTSRRLPIKQVSALMGGNVLLNTNAFKAIKGLDEDFFAYCEETDMCLRLIARGGKLFYNPDMAVWHKRNLSSDRMPFRKTYLSQRNKLIFIAKHFENKKWIKLIAIAAKHDFKMAVIGNTHGLTGIVKRHSAQHINATGRLAYLSVVLWSVSHIPYLLHKRRANKQDQSFNHRITDTLNALQD